MPSNLSKETNDPYNSYDVLDDLLANPFNNQDRPLNNDKQFDTLSINTFSMDTDPVTLKDPTPLIDRLSEAHQAQAQKIAEQIDPSQSQAILHYGSQAQKKLSDFSHSMLHQIQIKDTGEVGDLLTELMETLSNTDPQELSRQPNFWQKFLGKARQSITDTQLKYQKISSQLDKVSIRLEREKNDLIQDNLLLDQLYHKNKDYFDALNIYIAAGELKLNNMQEKDLKKAIEKANASKNQMDVQVVNDLQQFIERLDKRIYDLKLTRQITLQQAPQIRIIQNTNQALAEKIQVSIHTAIPLWENQITLALAILRQEKAANSQQIVSKTTNDLLKKNSAMLKQSTLTTLTETQKAVIDMDTLKQTQKDLIDTIESTLSIQSQARKQRLAASIELENMENQLREKLLEFSKQESKDSITKQEAQ